MGISFKLSKKGARYQAKARAVAVEAEDEGDLGGFGSPRGLSGAGSMREADIAEVPYDVTCIPVSSTCSSGVELPGLEEYDVSFKLNLFQNGFFIGKPTETENLQPLQDGKSLHPYNRASETLFSAIQSGCLPGDILDDIPSKYINGTLVCEVRDYRKCLPDQGTSGSTADGPVVNKVRLRMSLENVVKDIPLLSDDSWTYSDLMEVEARIVKALQPQLYLDPTPKLDRLCTDPCPNKLNLGIGRKRPWQTPEVTITSNCQAHGKKVCIDGVSGNDNCKLGGNAALQGIPENMEAQRASSGIPSTQPNTFAQETARPILSMQSQAKFQPAANFPGVMHDRGAGSSANFVGSTANLVGANANISSPQSLMVSYNDSMSGNASLLGKRENQDAQIAALSELKRFKQTQDGLNVVQQQQLGSQFVGPNAQDMNWKNQLIRSHLDVNGNQYPTVGGQRYPPQAMHNVSNQEAGTSFYFNQQGMKYAPKEEQTDMEKLDSKDALQAMARENSALDQQQTRPQHLLQQPSMRNHLPPLTQWHNPRPVVDKEMRKDDMLQKRKTLTSPRVSSGPMVQSPVSSKSGEISSSSVGQFSAVATTSALGSQKATANSSAAVGIPSATSSPNDSVHRQPQVSAAAKRKSNSATKTQTMSGVGSPASVSTMNAPLNASSPSIGTAPVGDLIERFTKIDMVTQSYQLNLKKTKVEEYPAKKAVGCPTQKLADLLNNSYNAEDFTDGVRPISRSLVGGNTNICKIRTMEFVRNEGNQAVTRRLVMAEKPFDGIVLMQYGDVDGSKFPNTHDCLLTLPTTNHADLLAAQFCALMAKDGYQKHHDQVQNLAHHFGSSPSVLTMVPGIASDDAAPEIKQEAAPSPLSNISNQSGNIGIGSPNPSQNLSNNSARMLASGSNNPALPISQGYFPGAGVPPRAQQLDQPLFQQQQQQQQIQQQQQQHMQQQQQIQQQQQLSLPQIQRASSMLSQNPLSQIMGQNSNLQMNANPMIANKSAPHLQLQMLQQQQQQQQQNPMQRKGLSAAMGNMSNNNMVGLLGLGNIMGMGGLRPMSGLSGIRPNQMNLGSMSNFGTGIRPGTLSADQAAAAMAQKLKQVQQNRLAAGMYGGQAGMVGGIPSSAGPSMLGHAMNRANMSQLQRNAMATMGPPKIPGANFYQQQQHLQLQQQQQQQQQQQSQLQQQQQQQQQQQLQQQQSHVGSPSIVTQHQQMSQQTAMSPQLSSGALQQQMNNNVGGNAGGAGPPSPQLSSQTHGSVGSITSSPMDQLQGANKGGGV